MSRLISIAYGCEIARDPAQDSRNQEEMLTQFRRPAMPSYNRKLPDDNKLARDLACGLTPVEIARRYKCTPNRVRKRLKLIDGTASAEPASAAPFGIPYIVVPKKVSAAEWGGTTVQNIRLPRISMHVAFLEGRT